MQKRILLVLIVLLVVQCIDLVVAESVESAKHCLTLPHQQPNQPVGRKLFERMEKLRNHPTYDFLR